MSAVADLTVPTKGPSFIAKEDGVCQLCDEPVEGGFDFICKVPRLKRRPYVHTHCADRYIRTLAEQLEDEAA